MVQRQNPKLFHYCWGMGATWGSQTRRRSVSWFDETWSRRWACCWLCRARCSMTLHKLQC